MRAAALSTRFESPQTAGIATCFHCGDSNPPGSAWRHRIAGVERAFCCAGCLAIARTIDAAGLAPYYEQRTAAGPRADADHEARARHAAQAVAAGLVTTNAGGECEASLLLEGLTCGACVWLVETWLRRQPGIEEASVNLATRRARVRWRGSAGAFADVLGHVAAIGYRAYAYDPARREQLLRREARALLLRMGVALLSMMQVMMLAVPAYLGDDTVEPAHRALLDWASLLLTLPVVLYSAAPFFAAAWRGLRARRLGMDVPVALGVGGAFAASAWATIAGHGPVYYDSVTMFVALLLVARYAELRAREKAASAIEAVARDLPATAERIADADVQTVPAHALRAGDLVRVAAGAVMPADGIVIEGDSSVEEALLTGESRPLRKARGERVLAGSVNRESPLTVRVTASGQATTLASLGRLVERAADARPRSVALAESVAAWFVGALLVVAAGAALFWWQHDASRALAVAFSVLVVSCPCALSLATPAAMAVAAGSLGRRGVLAVRPDALEALARARHVVLDKTGTLTWGRPRLTDVRIEGRMDRATCIATAAALEAGAAHPIAEALRAACAPRNDASDVVAVPGEGVEGTIDGRRYRCGRPSWVAQLRGLRIPQPAPHSNAIVVALADDAGWLATFTLADPLRPGSARLAQRLRDLGMTATLVSGDRKPVVRRIAQAAGIAHWRGDARPDDKRAFVEARQREGAVVAMVGDGINDAPALAQADVSVALGEASALAQWTADIVVLGDDVENVAVAFTTARRTFAIVRQNLGWALAYNVVAIPLAASGLVSPLVAALGMSLSSLLVVGNALRLMK
jgi:Cu2+-exporting ATPase